VVVCALGELRIMSSLGIAWLRLVELEFGCEPLAQSWGQVPKVAAYSPRLGMSNVSTEARDT
jgi:hypothetical protein